ncbi:hypothetical protein V1512DRAFT_268123 [Lipomyces arxii]|uniref:uncharacterized protein n=1 Tax=Lipomyces arxii TaxID=56418 RepID=UPI0034CF00C7
MGVHGLWTVLGPVARPVKLESLHGKKLAVDASIWIYHFLKAVRDKEGNALPNAHIVGFFRRICKLLFYGVQPVFVFDGDAPLIKKQTIAGRKQRRKGHEEDASRTSNKLLNLQMQKLAEEEVHGSRSLSDAVNDNDVVYFDELKMSKEERENKRQLAPKRFKKLDPYHLPDQGIAAKKDDPRVMTEAELERYAEEFKTAEDIGLYDTSNIDFHSQEFAALPITIQYQLLNTARLRSRLRMGYSKEQLDQIFPDRLQFSKFQIARVKERNMLTQKLFNLNGIAEDLSMRVAGERDKKYVLKKNDSGWTLALENNSAAEPIEIDDEQANDDDENEEWEDVDMNPIVDHTPVRKVIDDIKIQKPAPQNDQLFNMSDDESFCSDNKLPIGDEDQDLQTAISRSLETPERSPSMAVDVVDDESEGETLDDPGSAPAAGPFLWDIGDTDLSAIIASLPKLPTSTQPESQESSGQNESNFEASFTPSKFSMSNSLFSRKRKLEESTGKVSWEPVNAPVVNADLSQVGNTAVKIASKRVMRSTSVDVRQVNEFPSGPNVLSLGQDVETLETSTSNRSDIVVKQEPKSVSEIDSLRLEFIALSRVEKVESEAEHVEEGIKIDDSPDRSPVTATVNASSLLRNASSLSSAPESILDFETKLTPSSNVTTSMERDELPNREEVALNNGLSTQPFVGSENTSEDVNTSTSYIDALEPGGEGEEEGGQNYEEIEDTELVDQIAHEVQEHARFASEINPASRMSREDYDLEIRNLKSQRRHDRRDADQVTLQMVQECQDLLSRFGIPYVTAPMEAEAQCAELLELGLVDGVVTDDSDIFLFGASKVYKNMFNQAKFVECYVSSDILKELDLDRQAMINLAHLLGSDYASGLLGVGPVTAVQLIKDFKSEHTLQDFRDWWESIQRGDTDADVSTPFKKKFRKKSKKLFLSALFPEAVVDDAYWHPTIDSDKTAFVWGTPDLDRIRSFLMSTIGWSKERTDEVLVPLIKGMNLRKQSLVFDKNGFGVRK